MYFALFLFLKVLWFDVKMFQLYREMYRVGQKSQYTEFTKKKPEVPFYIKITQKSTDLINT